MPSKMDGATSQETSNPSDAEAVCVVDVGARGGVHGRWRTLPTGFRAVLFEADPEEQEVLRSQLPPSYTVLAAALSDKKDKREFFLCSRGSVSSFHRPDMNILARHPNPERFEVTKSLVIETDTLDSQLSTAGIMDVDFIKIDTEGHELPILQGSLDSLSRAIGVEAEILFSPWRQGGTAFHRLHEFLLEQGFELFDLRRTYWRRTNRMYVEEKGQLDHGDALYCRSPESICALPDISESKIIRAAMVYLAYGYREMVQVLCDTARDSGMISGVAADRMLASARHLGPRRFNFPGQLVLRNFLNRLGRGIAGLAARMKPPEASPRTERRSKNYHISGDNDLGSVAT